MLKCRLMLAVMLLLGCCLLSGCGNCVVNGELVGQAKKVIPAKNITMPDFTAVDVSLGVVRNGVGSMSGQDVYVRLANPEQIATAKQAAESGLLVKIVYDEARFWWFSSYYRKLAKSITIIP